MTEIATTVLRFAWETTPGHQVSELPVVERIAVRGIAMEELLLGQEPASSIMPTRWPNLVMASAPM